MNLVNFRDFLKPLSCLLPEFKKLQHGISVLPPLRRFYTLMSFLPRWRVASWKKLLCNSLLPKKGKRVFLIHVCVMKAIISQTYQSTLYGVPMGKESIT